jgi:hypothetical protein
VGSNRTMTFLDKDDETESEEEETSRALVMKAGKMYLMILINWKKSTRITTILSRLTYKSLKKNLKIWH